MNLREALPGLASTTVANMTAPLLREIAIQLAGDPGDRGRALRSLPAVAPASPPPISNTTAAPPDRPPALQSLILSGLLPSELDDIATAFAPLGLAESERRRDGDWAALLLRRELS